LPENLTPTPHHRVTPVTIYDAAGTSGGNLPVAVMGSTTTQALAVNVGDGTSGSSVLAAGLHVYNGATWDRQRTPLVFKPIDLAAATAEATIWTPTTGKKFRLMGFILTVGAASTLTFKDNTGGTTIFIARGGTDTPLAINLGNGILSGAINRLLTVTRGTSATLTGTVYGTEE